MEQQAAALFTSSPPKMVWALIQDYTQKLEQGSEHTVLAYYRMLPSIMFLFCCFLNRSSFENDFSQVSINLKWWLVSLNLNEVLLYPKQPLSMDFALVLASNNDLNAVSEDSCFPEKIKILEENQITSQFFFYQCSSKDHIQTYCCESQSKNTI